MIEIIACMKPYIAHGIRRGKQKWFLSKSLPHKGMPFKVYCCLSGYSGRIYAEFVCDMFHCFDSVKDIPTEILSELGMRADDVELYAKGKPVYLWHVRDVVDYCDTKGRHILSIGDFGLSKAPTRWCYVK